MYWQCVGCEQKGYSPWLGSQPNALASPLGIPRRCPGGPDAFETLETHAFGTDKMLCCYVWVMMDYVRVMVESLPQNFHGNYAGKANNTPQKESISSWLHGVPIRIFGQRARYPLWFTTYFAINIRPAWTSCYCSMVLNQLLSNHEWVVGLFVCFHILNHDLTLISLLTITTTTISGLLDNWQTPSVTTCFGTSPLPITRTRLLDYSESWWLVFIIYIKTLNLLFFTIYRWLSIQLFQYAYSTINGF